jgi:integrase
MRPVSIERLEVEILSTYEPPQRAKATLRQMVQTFREIKAIPGVTRSSHLRQPAVSAWIIAHPGRSPARVESLLRCWRIIANYAVDEGFLRVSPFERRKVNAWVRADAVKKKTKLLYRSAQDIRSFLRLLDAEASASWQARRLQALGYVYVFTGFRKGEGLHLLARNVDFARQTITIEPLPEFGWIPKTVKSARTLPLATPLADVLKIWVPMCGANDLMPFLFPGTRLKGPWTGGSGKYTALESIKIAAKRANLADGMTILGARKSAGTNAKAMGLGQIERMLLFGHTDEATGEHYDEEQIETMRPAIKKLELFYGTAD